jgi:signal transduction histidine kinase
MHPYVLIPLASCVLCLSLAVALHLRDQDDRLTRAATALFGGAAWWAFWEVAWNLAPSPEVAFWFLRLSSPGYCFIGPLAVHVFHEMGDGRVRAPALHLRWLYAVAAAFVVLTCTTPWMTREMVPVPWGWAYAIGPAFPVFYLFTLVCGVFALRSWLRATREEPLLTDRPARVVMTLGLLAPLIFASLTDAVLPMMQIYVPRVGTASFAVFSALALWAHVQRGYLFVSPTVFASEILATLPDGVALVGAAGEVQLANAGLARLLRVPRETLLGAPFSRFLGAPRLDARRPLHEHECELEPRGGDAVPVAISTSTLRDRNGRALGIVVLVRDLREVAELRRRLVTSGRLAAVGQLAAGIAHEINNPIAFVRTNLGLLREHWSQIGKALRDAGTPAGLDAIVDEADELIDESLEGIDRAAAIVRDVQGFSRAGEGRRELVDVHAVLDQVIRFAMPDRYASVGVVKRYDDEPLLVAASPQLKQVFLNLILNGLQAIEATGRRGTLEISTHVEENDAVVRVVDDGCGIQAESLDRVFDPFFTTKPEGQGTGLGLAISHEIVRRLGGSLSVTSTPGEHTCFSVRLPLDEYEG